jgi:hypothetical protein
MQIFLITDASTQSPQRDRANERGAALLTVLLFSVLVLAAGGALIMTTALSATNAGDATAETQAYYAAEAGMQATLAVLRGNVAPNPLFDTSSATAPANKISFRKAVTLSSSNASTDAANSSANSRARLSRWLSYNALTDDSRIEISSPYSPLSGMAYDTKVEDPDNTVTETYSTLGSFGADTPSSSSVSYQFGFGGTRVTVHYDPQASTAITAGGTTLGAFYITQLNGTPDLCAIDPVKCTFTITIRQVNTSGTIDAPVKCTLALSGSNVSVTFNPPSTTSNNILGTTYAHLASIPFGTTSVPVPVTITPPEPPRVKVTVTGYGPRGAKKQMHMLVSKFALDFKANAAITIRGADPVPSGIVMTSFTVGSSSPFGYSGFDTSGGAPLPAFVVTNDLDSALVNTTIAGLGGNVTGSPTAAKKATLSELPIFLQTAQGARDTLNVLRVQAQEAYWPLATPPAVNGPANDRYFPAGTTPSTFGSVSNPLITFVDGDCALPPGGGAGLLVLTGILDMRGSADFKGLVLVLGSGQVLRNGGGSDSTLGAMDIARFGPTGNFLPPSFDSNGSGASQLDYDSKWLDTALASAGPSVRGVSEY